MEGKITQLESHESVVIRENSSLEASHSFISSNDGGKVTPLPYCVFAT